MFDAAFFNTFMQGIELLSAIVGLFGAIIVVIVAAVDPARRPTMKVLGSALGVFVAVMLILLLVTGNLVNWSKQQGITQATPTHQSGKTPTVTATHRPSRTPTSTPQKQGTSTTTTSSSGTTHVTAPTTTPTPRPTSPSTTGISFDFESGIQNWGTSEGAYKKAVVSSTTTHAFTGLHSLEVTTVLQGDKSPAYNGNNVYLHTEATAYFNNAIPQNIGAPGPYNLTGKLVSCYVYLPTGLENGAYIRLFAKDTSFRNDFESQVNITQANVNQWIQLSFVVSADPNNADPNFDPTRVNTIGVRIETPDGSTLNYNGSFYIDDCSI